MFHKKLKSSAAVLGLAAFMAAGIYGDYHVRAKGAGNVKNDIQVHNINNMIPKITNSIEAGCININEDFKPSVIMETKCSPTPVNSDIGKPDTQEPVRDSAPATEEPVAAAEETKSDISETSTVSEENPEQAEAEETQPEAPVCDPGPDTADNIPEPSQYCMDGAMCHMTIPSAEIDADVFPCERQGAPDLYDVSMWCGGGYVGDLDSLLVCGHNTRTLKRLKHTAVGDIITLTAPDGATFIYKVDVSKTCLVADGGVNLTDPDTGEQYITTTYGAPAMHLTIYTCCGDDSRRYVVRAIRMTE